MSPDAALRRAASAFGRIGPLPRPRLSRRRAPVLLQLNAAECGAACLAMILSYHGRATRVAECREHLAVGRDGSSALALADAARGFGLRVKAYSIEPAALGRVPLPAIVHWEFNHFLVVEAWSPTAVDVIDPAVGRRRLSAAEFGAGFTGVVLLLEPGLHFARQRGDRGLGWRGYLGAHARQVPGLLGQVAFASLLLQLLGLALPLFTKVLFDRILPYRATDLVTVLGLGAGLMLLTQVVASYLRSVLLIQLGARLDAHVMLGFFEHLLALPFRFFEQRASGDLLMRLGSNVVVREALTSQTLATVLDGGLVVGYLALLFLQAPILGALALGAGALQVALLVGARPRAQALLQQELTTQASSQSYLVEALAGIATLKASGGEERAFRRWTELFVQQLNVSARRGHLTAVVETALLGLRSGAPLLLLWVGALRVLDGTLSLGGMLALNLIAAAVLTSLASLVSSLQQLQLVGVYLDRLADVLEAEPEQRPEQARPTPRLSGRIELRNVGFRYAPDGPWVLRDVSLVIEPGQKVALVGRTGAGKSTLVKLLLGLYRPTEGEILYDGQPLDRLEHRSLRRQFGVVLQEPFLFSGSIRQSIAFNDPDLPLERVVEAARVAVIDDEIRAMPMSYETPVGEGGGGVSGGQRQRLSLARAVAHRPAVLVLDEATSHLDTATEAAIDRNLSHLACTRVVIAHRLSTVRNADQIVVLEGGQVVERGGHDDLVARGEQYAALVAG
jgi:ABC-type bacteriocin/lantibiotic exporter with double-glycine peptidase domain